jgi:hypothetical protein
MKTSTEALPCFIPLALLILGTAEKTGKITRCESRSAGQNWFVGMIFAKFILFDNSPRATISVNRDFFIFSAKFG